MGDNWDSTGSSGTGGGGGAYNNMNNNGMNNFTGGGGDADGGGDGSHQNQNYSSYNHHDDSMNNTAAGYNTNNNGGMQFASGYGGVNNDMRGDHHGFQPQAQGYNDGYGMTNHQMGNNNVNMGVGHSNNNMDIMGGGYSQQQTHHGQQSQSHSTTFGSSTQADAANLMLLTQATQHGDNNPRMSAMGGDDGGVNNTSFENDLSGADVLASLSAPKQTMNNTSSSFNNPSTTAPTTTYDQVGHHQQGNMMGNESMNVNVDNFNNTQTNHNSMMTGHHHQGQSQEQFTGNNNMGGMNMNYPSHNDPPMDNSATSNSMGIGDPSTQDANALALASLSGMMNHNNTNTNDNNNSDSNSNPVSAPPMKKRWIEAGAFGHVEAIGIQHNDDGVDNGNDNEQVVNNETLGGDEGNEVDAIMPLVEEEDVAKPTPTNDVTESGTVENNTAVETFVGTTTNFTESTVENNTAAETFGQQENNGEDADDMAETSAKAFELQAVNNEEENASSTEKDNMPDESQEDGGDNEYTKGEVEPVGDDPFGEDPDASSTNAFETQVVNNEEVDAPTTEKDLPDAPQENNEFNGGEVETAGEDLDASTKASETQAVNNEEVNAATTEKDLPDAPQENEGAAEPDKPDVSIKAPETHAMENEEVNAASTEKDLPEASQEGGDEFMKDEAEPVGEDESQTLDNEEVDAASTVKDNLPDAPQEGDEYNEDEAEPAGEDHFGDKTDARTKTYELQAVNNEEENAASAEKHNLPGAPQEGDEYNEDEAEPLGEDPFGENPGATTKAPETQTLDNEEVDAASTEKHNLPGASQEGDDDYMEGEAEPLGDDPFGENPDACTKAPKSQTSDNEEVDAASTEKGHLPGASQEGDDDYMEGEAEPLGDDPFGENPDASTKAPESQTFDNEEGDVPNMEQDQQEGDAEYMEGEAEPVGDDPFGENPDASTKAPESQTLGNEDGDVPNMEKGHLPCAQQEDGEVDAEYMEGEAEPVGDDPFGENNNDDAEAIKGETTNTADYDAPLAGIANADDGNVEISMRGETKETAEDTAAVAYESNGELSISNASREDAADTKPAGADSTSQTEHIFGGQNSKESHWGNTDEIKKAKFSMDIDPVLASNESDGKALTKDTPKPMAITVGLLDKESPPAAKEYTDAKTESTTEHESMEVTKDGEEDDKFAESAPTPEHELEESKGDMAETMSLEEDKALDGSSDASLPDGVERVTFTSNVDQAATKSEESSNVQPGMIAEGGTSEAPLPTKLPGTGAVSLRGKLTKTTKVHKISGVWALGLDTILADPENLKGICLDFEYEHKLSGASEEAALSGKYNGWFHLNSDDGLSKVQSPEKDIDLAFTKNSEGYYNVEGSGSNFAGSYSIIGTLTADGVMTMCRKFEVKPKPKPKRTKKAAKARLSSGRKRAKHSLGGTPKSKSPKSGASPKQKKAVAVKHPDSGKRYGVGKPDLLCDCCFFEEDGEVGKTPFIKCLHCGLVAHTACYPPTSAVDEKGNFLCDVCTSFFHPSVNKDMRTKHPEDGNIETPKPLAEDIEAKGDGRLHREGVYCELCARRDVLGGMKPTDSNSWVHLACLMCTDHAYFDDKTAVQVQGALKKNRTELISQKKVIGSKPKCEECSGESGMLLKCKHDGCNLYTHALCAEILDRLRVVENNGQRDIISYKCELHSYCGLDACGVCKLSNKQSEMLECDKCNQGYHMFCMDPPLTEVPEGDWFCHKC